MQRLRDVLKIEGAADVRTAVLDDLCTYHGITPDEAVERCINWEQMSVREWRAGRRDSPEAIAEFYRSLESWSFDLLWYAYLQTAGFARPISVVAARALPLNGREHLDFGSGCGALAQLVGSLGYNTTLADVSSSLLTFAQFRFERRGQQATYIDLNHERVPAGRYDAITAIDTLVHVANLADAVAMLHASLKPGGCLVANFDVRPAAPENAWHLYDDEAPLRFTLQRAGFEPELNLGGGLIRYRRVEPNGVRHAARGARDAIILRTPVGSAARKARRRLRSFGI